MPKPGRPPIDLDLKVRDLLGHLDPPVPEAASPIAHYRLAVGADFSLIRYLDKRLGAKGYAVVRDRHLSLLHRFVLADLIQTFERFLKGLAALCIDQLLPHVIDDRFDGFRASGDAVIAHFGEGTVGKALCESDTWLRNGTINDRFRKILGDVGGKPWGDHPFPSRSESPASERDRAATLAILWQVRHNLAHNAGLLTGSDAVKLGALSHRRVDKDHVLAPTAEDLRYIKRFLTQTAESTNARVASRLAAVLTEIHAADPVAFQPSTKAAALARAFQTSITIASATVSP